MYYIFIEVDSKKNQTNPNRFTKSEQNTNYNNNTQSNGKNNPFDNKDAAVINISYVSIKL